MGKKILLPQDIAEAGKEFLRQQGYELKMGTGISEEEMAADCRDCDAILLRTARCTRKVLEAAPKLKIVARHGAGYNNVDCDAAAELGIWVTNTPDATTNTVAEFTIGALLVLAKQMLPCRAAMMEGDFYYKNTHKGVDLEGKTLAVIGLGRIGAAVAKKAHYGFGMKVIAYNPRRHPEREADYIRMVSLEEAFAQADFVSLHMPLTKETREIVGESLLSRMKPDACLLNCSRGELVDEKALQEILEKKKIAGAFLDVLQEEPVRAEHPLLKLENVVATPHMASNTLECMDAMALLAAGQIDRVLRGELPDFPVNEPEQGARTRR